jgi:hypothetical protein
MSAPQATSTPRVTANVVFALVSIALLAYTDWIANRQIAVAIVLGGGAAAIVLFRREIVQQLGLGPLLGQLPAWLRPILAAAPAVLYFLVRGQGTSGSGLVVLVAIGVTILVATVFGRAIDAKFAGLYRARNKILPMPVRMALALIVPVFLAFLVIHGSLADLSVMFGGTSNDAMSPVGGEGMFFLGTLLSAAVAYLLAHDTAGSSAVSAAPVAQPIAVADPTTPLPAPPMAVSTPWTPTHVVPMSGLRAWAAPDPGASVLADLQAGLPLRVVGRAGEWGQVQAENGWTGWVDARRLAPMGAS